MALKTDWKDYIPPATGRVYRPTYNTDGTMSLVDVTAYQQMGDQFGAAELNWINGCLANMGSNLLDNSDFANPVNQRGATTYTGGGAAVYSIDRWKIVNAADFTVSIYNGAIKLTHPSTASESAGNFWQYIEGTKIEENQIYTVSVYADGILYTLTAPFSTTQASLTTPFGNIGFIKYSSYYIFQICLSKGSTTNLKWAKLEKGSIATPYMTKGYGAELAECQRYYQTKFYVMSSGIATAFVNFAPQMRVAPTCSLRYAGDGGGTGISQSSPPTKIGATVYTTTYSTGYIDASADL